MTLDPPPGWGHDPVSQLLDVARSNAFATFMNRYAETRLIIDVDTVLRTLANNIRSGVHPSVRAIPKAFATSAGIGGARKWAGGDSIERRSRAFSGLSS